MRKRSRRRNEPLIRRVAESPVPPLSGISGTSSQRVAGAAILDWARGFRSASRARPASSSRTRLRLRLRFALAVADTAGHRSSAPLPGLVGEAGLVEEGRKPAAVIESPARRRDLRDVPGPGDLPQREHDPGVGCRPHATTTGRTDVHPTTLTPVQGADVRGLPQLLAGPDSKCGDNKALRRFVQLENRIDR